MHAHRRTAATVSTEIEVGISLERHLNFVINK